MLAQSLLEMKPAAVMKLDIRKGRLDRVDNSVLEVMNYAPDVHLFA
jgi:hypothetical protein